MRVALMLHLIGAVVWIGGMFFAYFALRPSAAQLLQPPQRLPLWTATLGRFFQWVWLSVVLVLGSGFYMFAVMADAARIPLYGHVMLDHGVVMTLIFGDAFFSPFATLKRAVAVQNWEQAAAALNQIRVAVAVNLALGLTNIAVATAGAGLG